MQLGSTHHMHLDEQSYPRWWKLFASTAVVVIVVIVAAVVITAATAAAMTARSEARLPCVRRKLQLSRYDGICRVITVELEIQPRVVRE